MTLKSWKYDAAFIRPAHKWEFVEAKPLRHGIWAVFKCVQPGCASEIYISVDPDKSLEGGLCFDRNRGIQLADEDGEPLK